MTHDAGTHPSWKKDAKDAHTKEQNFLQHVLASRHSKMTWWKIFLNSFFILFFLIAKRGDKNAFLL